MGECVAHLSDRDSLVRHPDRQFFEPLYDVHGDTIPTTTSRHATAHKPTAAHLSRANTRIAMMLCVSILRDMQEWIREIDVE
jgi:hypothetical protein